jgi:hypothetical protein
MKTDSKLGGYKFIISGLIGLICVSTLHYYFFVVRFNEFALVKNWFSELCEIPVYLMYFICLYVIAIGIQTVIREPNLEGTFYLGVNPLASRKGRSPITEAIEKSGAREGEVVAIEKDENQS